LKRITNRRKASPLYGSLGPLGPAVLQRYPGDLARHDQVLADFQAWHAEHYEAWKDGEAVPEPPGWEEFDTYAKPAGWAA
jgi:hypothetical protein